MNDIQAGDLVMVVKLMPCGCGRLGKVFSVTAVRPSKPKGIRCKRCQALFPAEMIAERDGGDVAHLWRLRKIPPLSELEETGAEHNVVWSDPMERAA